MADRTLAVKLTADDQLSATFAKAGDSARRMGDDLEKSSESAKTLSSEMMSMEKSLNTAGMTMTAMGAAGTAFFGLATKSSMDFTSAMANVNSIARLSESELGALSNSILDLSTQFGSMPTDLAEGLYDIIGSGFEASEAMDILTASTAAAGAGLTTTATATAAITAVLNAYGMSAEEAGNVSDILFKVMDSGVITFEELAGSLGRTLPIAASLGVELEELGAAYAALTLVGISPSEAETGIAAIMQAAISPTEALTAAVQAYGYESAEAMIQTEGFAGFLEFLRRETNGSSSEMAQFLPSVRALNAAMALGTRDGQVYADMLDDMGMAAQDGAYTLEVFGIQMDNAAGSVRLMQAEMAVAAINIGAVLEPIVNFGAGAAAGAIGWFNDLTPAVQGGVAALGAIGSGFTLVTGAAILAIPRLREFVQAMRVLRTTAVGGALFGPWGLAIAGIATAVGVGMAAWNGHKKSVEEAEAAYESVGQAVIQVQDIVNNLRLGGDLELSAQIEEMNLWSQAMVESSEQMRAYEADWSDFWGQALNVGYKRGTTDAGDFVREYFDSTIGRTFIAWAEENQHLGPEVIDILMTGTGDELFKTVAEIQPLMDEFFATFDVPPHLQQSIAENTADLTQMMTQPLVDSEQVFADWAAARDKYLGGTFQDWEGYETWLREYTTELPKVTAEAANADAAMYGMSESTREAAASAEELLSIFDQMPATIDQLRLSGDWGLADQLESMQRDIQAAFTTTTPGEFFGLGGPVDEVYTFIEVANLAEPEIESLGDAWQRSMKAMSSGTIDNIAYMEDWNAILQNSLLTDAEKVAALEELSYSTHEYRDSQKAMQQDQLDWLNQGDNILEWWEEYDRLINQGAASLDGSAEQLARIEAQEAFRGMVDWAQDMNSASNALDQVLRTFQQIDDLGSRSSSAGSIAENLVGKPGEWAEIDQMLQDGRITLEEYNEAVAAGHEIQLSNLRVQEDLDSIRRKQLPLLEEEQLAYEENIAYLNTLNAEEQRRALMLQDTAVQSEIAAAYNLAYSASLGEIPKEVATEMLINTAQADPALADLLVQFGLLEETVGPDGELTYSVNFPDADTTIDSINRLTIAFIEFEAAARGMSGFELAVELYGEEEAYALYGMVQEADGTTATLNMEAVDNATGTIDGVRDLIASTDGMSATTTVTNYVQTILETYERYFGPTPFAHGGFIPAFANGGVTFRAGEIGAEIAHFPHGGTALIPRDGIYQAPAGTYISPNNAVGNSHGGINIDFSGAVFHNTSRAEMNAWAREDFLPEIKRAAADLKTGMGVA